MECKLKDSSGGHETSQTAAHVELIYFGSPERGSWICCGNGGGVESRSSITSRECPVIAAVIRCSGNYAACLPTVCLANMQLWANLPTHKTMVPHRQHWQAPLATLGSVT